jgi:hypothetical protein
VLLHGANFFARAFWDLYGMSNFVISILFSVFYSFIFNHKDAYNVDQQATILMPNLHV